MQDNEKAGLFFRAIPGDGKVGVGIGVDGQPVTYWPNTLVLPTTLMTQVRTTARDYWYPQPEAETRLEGLSWAINWLTDIDDYPNALIALDDAFGTKLPIFNHPRSIAMTRRDLSSRLLQGIPNLTVPRCIRFEPRTASDFQQIFSESGFHYPVLVRPCKGQSATGLIKVDSPLDWARVLQTPWIGKAHFMTEFIDFRSVTGGYIRLRIAFVGETLVLRGYTKQSSWLIRRAWGDTPTLADIDLFLEKVEEFPAWHKLHEICREVVARGKLDFWGIDLGMISENCFVLFEANAAMSILDPYGTPPDVMKRVQEYFNGLTGLVGNLIATPKRWRADARLFPSVADILGSPLDRMVPKLAGGLR